MLLCCNFEIPENTVTTATCLNPLAGAYKGNTSFTRCGKLLFYKLQIWCIFPPPHFNVLLGSEAVVNHLQTLFGIMFHVNQSATMLI